MDPFHRATRMHSGIDIPGRIGTPIRAAEDGIVRHAGRAGGYGNLIEIAHPGGTRTRYGHLARILVPAGAQVRRGETIAQMGSTGRSTGSHLHFELHENGRAIDPLPHLRGEAPARENVPLPAAAPHISAFARTRAQTKDSGTVP
ncbi:M23 family metallopeptidase [Sphingomonas koreensis]|uniref:M23 family metallopeptidase n=1 Tax=Sphingomonas koreensis TaxID=93064 RepID=UPI001F498CBD|nr:M23 family metallopeptidase [Sphingomonas koreensis]